MKFRTLVGTALIAICAPAWGQKLVVDYEFEHNVLDISSNGNNGQVEGTMSYVPSDTSYAARFMNPYGNSGATNYVLIPNSASVTALQDSSFTFLIRYLTTDTSQQNGRLFGSGFAGPDIAYDYNAQVCPEACWQLEDDNGKFLTTEGLVAGNHAAITTNGFYNWGVGELNRAMGDMSLYVNETEVADLHFTGLGQINFPELAIGAVNNQLTYAARNTNVDRFLLFNGALTPQQISGIENATPEPRAFLSLVIPCAGFGFKRRLRSRPGRHADLGCAKVESR